MQAQRWVPFVSLKSMLWRASMVGVLGFFTKIGFDTPHPFWAQAIATAAFFVIFGVCFMSGIEYQRER